MENIRYEIIDGLVYSIDDLCTQLIGSEIQHFELNQNDIQTQYVVKQWNSDTNDYTEYTGEVYNFKGVDYSLVNSCFAYIKPISHERLAKQTHEGVETTGADNLLNMDMLVTIDEKLTKIMQHLNIQ